MRLKQLLFTMLFCLMGIFTANAENYTLGTTRIDVTEPGSHYITGKGSGGCTVYIIKEETNLSDAVYNITLENFYLKSGSWASAIVIENNAASGSMTVNFIVEGDNYTSGYNHGGIKVERGTVSVVFSTSNVGKLTCDAQYEGTYALQAASPAVMNASIGTGIYGSATLNGESMEVADAVAGAFTERPLVILLSKTPIFKAGDVWYNIISEDDKTVEVAVGLQAYTGEIEIPATIEHNGVTYNVTTIGDNAFFDCTGLTNITIPESVTTIGDNVFKNCTSLNKVTVQNPEPVAIDANVFDGIDLTNDTLYVPAGTKIDYEADEVWGTFGTIIEMGDATLASLAVTPGELTPAFSAEVTAYTVNVGNEVTEITITATPNHASATATGHTGKQPLNVGANTFTITVTAEDEITTKEYTIVVTRADKVGLVDIKATDIKVYPNPVVDMLYIESPVAVQAVVVYDITGAIVLSQNNIGNSVDVSKLQQGVYVAKFATSRGEVIRKIVK